MKVEVPEVKEEDVIINSRSSALIVVDMQNDFVRKEGKLYVPSAESTIMPISNLIRKFKERNSLVIYTQDWHMKDDPEFKIWGEHALANTWGAEIVDELRPDKDDFLIKKYRYDGFFESPLDYILRVKGVRKVVITGTVANICVLHTAGSAALRWYDVILPKDGISAITDFDYYSTLRQVSFLYRGAITSSERISLT
ncbi:isochorismatase [Sulfolobales archaeon HS-7]|nr:isochorismatase [Sulfolobales archaeon HS-7]